MFGRQQRDARGAAREVSQRTNHTGLEEAVVLRELFPIRLDDLHLSRRHPAEIEAEVLRGRHAQHHGLHDLLEVGSCGCERRHVSILSGGRRIRPMALAH
jgi:hypothetical protein